MYIEYPPCSVLVSANSGIGIESIQHSYLMNKLIEFADESIFVGTKCMVQGPTYLLFSLTSNWFWYLSLFWSQRAAEKLVNTVKYYLSSISAVGLKLWTI